MVVLLFKPNMQLDKSYIKNELGEKPISVIVHEEIPITVLTPGDVVGDGLLDYITRPDGSRIAIPSPSYLVAKALRKRLTHLNIEEVPNSFTPRPANNEASIYPKSYNLSLFVNYNYLGYRPLAWQTYQYQMNALGTLRDPSGNIVWKQDCKVGGLSGDETLQLDRLEFKNNNAKRLKEILNVAANRCAKELAAEFGAGKT